MTHFAMVEQGNQIKLSSFARPGQVRHPPPLGRCVENPEAYQ